MQAEAVLHEGIPAARTQILRIVEPRAAGIGHETEQHVGQPVSRNLAIVGKCQESARLHVAEGILLQIAEIGSRLDQVPAAA